MRKKLLELLVLGLVTAGLALLCEGVTRGILRWSAGTWPTTRAEAFYRTMEASLALYREHAFLNTAPREGASVVAFGKEASFSSRGYRSPERPLERPAGTLRLVFSGGSTTFDLLAARDEETWVHRVEEKHVSAAGSERLASYLALPLAVLCERPGESAEPAVTATGFPGD